ncbi:MAG TPA: hypothetical protein VNL14_16355 [Candidatus Acidoferrales bacterium]|nr:hypothetical protein [Candidatus Acidoferrales bacterium]
MRPFAHSFLVLLQQVAVGGLFALAAAPFHELERGFFKSTAAVLFLFGLLSVWGQIEIYGAALWKAPDGLLELAVQAAFLVCFGLYLFSLWGERVYFRARVFSLALFAGLGSLVLNSLNFHRAPLWSIESLLYPLSFFVSALLLGAVTVGMLIGHWYLIDAGQSLAPLIRMFRFFVASLVLQTAFLLVFPPLLYFLGSPASLESMTRLLSEHPILLAARLTVAQGAPLVISYMIWRTLKIPHTMAATGLFYVAMLGVFVGEILGRQILALTALPF